MDEKGNTSYVGRLKAKLNKNRRIQNELFEKVKRLEEELTKDHENCQSKINDLEEEIKRLKEEIEKLKEESNTLKEEIKKLKKKTGDLGESNAFLEKKMKEIDDNAKKEANKAEKEIGDLNTKLENLDEKLKMFELSEDELVIRQLCSSVQQNLLKIVLQGNFEEIQNKRTEDMENYISTQIEDEHEQNEARLRWKKLKKDVNWNDFLIRQLTDVKRRGNETAHPSLTEEDIDDAKINLKEKKKLGKHMVKAVDQLKVIWIQTNRKLYCKEQAPLTKKKAIQGLRLPQDKTRKI
ncbi:uncharacterized protein PFB0765w-like [Actinia tenebrosa]|uniref:Uncharacterized protein PFB0765w-like n=1 Tax=Actinia tenebrosa TaxID=6105 RepID=A0A6P8H5A4_ACTTE|nr:uncharacterized protein PFB0765w-like [Actinia tenebrosa]